MKKILLILLMLPIFAMAQQKEGLEESMKELEEMKKDMTPEQRAMLEKMGIEKTLKTAQKTMQKGGTGVAMMPKADPNKIPDKISKLAIPATPASKQKLVMYLQTIFGQTEQAMKPGHVKSVENLLNDAEKTGKYAMAFWTHNELDKALYLLSNACVINPDDYASINNLGALLTISGYAHKALPLLLYIQKFVPKSSTLLNNLGQAYLSLGYVDKAKPFFLSAIAKDSTKAESYRSMALIAQKQGNPTLCGNYLEKAIAHGGATSENINLLNQVAPGKDLSPYIRSRFQQFYKDVSVTKTFAVPQVPNSYVEAKERDAEIEKYFRDLESTISAAVNTNQELNENFQKQAMASQEKKAKQIQEMFENMGKPGYSNTLYTSNEKPFAAQGAIMLANIDNPQYSKSYFNRMKDLDVIRLHQENVLKEALKGDFDNKIDALQKEYRTLNAGEGHDKENARAIEIEKELCNLKSNRQAVWFNESSLINNEYIHNMQSLLKQRLQEYLFWNSIVMQAAQQDPAAINFTAYLTYLQAIYNMAYSLFPTHVDGGLTKPCSYDAIKNNYRGKIHDWEIEHCVLDFGIDLVVTGFKMNCTGWSVYSDFKAGKFTYTQSIDPVTWEATGHSISAKAGKEKEFDITKNLTGKVGATVETTIKFDSNMIPVDLIVKGEAGATLEGPYGGSASVNIFTEEISVSSGFNASGPSIPDFGSDFLK